MRIALTGGRSPLALYFAKKLSEQGHKLFMLEHFSPTFATYSSFFEEVKLIASPAKNWTLFSKQVLAYLQANAIDLLLPINEETLYYAQLQAELHKLGITFLIGELPLLETLHNKYYFINWCESIGIAVPHTEKYYGQDVDFTQNLVKPEYSRFGQAVFLDEHAFSKAPTNKAYLVQEKLAGQQICVCLMIKDSQLVSVIAHDTNLGIESYASITYVPFQHPQLDQLITRLAENLGANGFYSFDFFFTGTDFYPIECNPRLTVGAILDGDNLIAHLLGEVKPQAIRSDSYGIKLVWWWRIITRRNWRQTIRSYKQANDVLKEAFTFKTWCMLPWVLASYYVKGRQLGLNVTDFVVHDISYPPPSERKEQSDDESS
ncbi:ATP-grasp domain-containing protein [Amphibacillus marinus]|uniref:ATP-grasp domain-containing protein n=1 Tax=Amphibacillus marinus TaxID=872970 RepID=A0A1H8L955_9BACI|nr:ATP-grasp domain-containing protein [Amphibacillus marinus]SEO01647.1 ATP-grasp domain-containing protein [Amphibacillus marinus]